nr:carboxymuconolactone decarboxylase family protein [Amycolatopsis antarctica]
MTGSSRLEPGTRAELGLPIWAFVRLAGRVTRGEPPRLFLILGKNRRLFRSWLRFAARLMPRGKLPRRETELVILRVAGLCGCDYEYEHHVRMARRAGVSRAEIDGIADRAEREWSPRESAILLAVEQLHTDRTVDDKTWETLRPHLSDPEIVELFMLVGHYEMLALVIGGLRIRPDGHLAA